MSEWAKGRRHDGGSACSDVASAWTSVAGDVWRGSRAAGDGVHGAGDDGETGDVGSDSFRLPDIESTDTCRCDATSSS